MVVVQVQLLKAAEQVVALNEMRELLRILMETLGWG